MSPALGSLPESLLSWKIRDRSLSLSRRPLVMGILNVTPDSFYDGGCFLSLDDALKQALKMVEEGADILDVGGLSTKPGSLPDSWEEEARRVIPVIKRMRPIVPVPISIDTYHSEVASLALNSGADIVNDISSFQLDPRMAEVVVQYGAGLILMHMRGVPATMQQDTHYDDLLGEIEMVLKERISCAVDRGVMREQIVIDPGIGFGKSAGQNLDIIRSLDRFHALGQPILLGASRKSFIGHVLDRAAQDRLAGSLAVSAFCFLKGVSILRVHDVRETVDCLKMLEKLTDTFKS